MDKEAKIELEKIKAEYLLKAENSRKTSIIFLYGVIGIAILTIAAIISIPYFMDYNKESSFENIDKRISELDSLKRNTNYHLERLRNAFDASQNLPKIEIQKRVDSINHLADNLFIKDLLTYPKIIKTNNLSSSYELYFDITRQAPDYRIKLGTYDYYFETLDEAQQFGIKMREKYPKLSDFNEPLFILYQKKKEAERKFGELSLKTNNYTGLTKQSREQDSLRGLIYQYNKTYESLLENKGAIEAYRLTGKNKDDWTELLRINLARIFVIIILIFFSKVGIQQYRYYTSLSQHYQNLHDALKLYINNFTNLEFDRLVHCFSIQHHFKDLDNELNQIIEVVKK